MISATSSRILRDRPLPRIAVWGVLALVALGMAWLFAEPLATYRLHSDDFEYLSASRTFDRAVSNLFRAHNTHIVPAWRLLTYAVMQTAGRLANLQPVLACVSFAALVLAGLALYRFVARELGHAWLGVLAFILLGTTSLLKSSATWYSSGQTLWAALGILLMLLCLQSWRTHQKWPWLVAASLCAWAAGAFWTIGHAAGPTGAVYLWNDGRRNARIAAVIPLLATGVSIALALVLGGRYIDAKISFHGRTQSQAINALAGTTHTLQAIPENLVGENLGLEFETTELQGALLTSALIAAWLCTWRVAKPGPLEWTGGCLLSSAYLVEWSFRGYLPFSSLRGIVPWYDTIPHIGLVLILCGTLARVLRIARKDQPSPYVAALTKHQTAALLLAQLLLIGVHAPRVEQLYINDVPAMSEAESATFLTHDLQRTRAQLLAKEYARLQRIDLAKLDQATQIGRRLGIGRDQIAHVFGRVDILELPKVYDAIGLLDLPASGKPIDPTILRNALARSLTPSPAPTIPAAFLKSSPSNPESAQHPAN